MRCTPGLRRFFNLPSPFARAKQNATDFTVAQWRFSILRDDVYFRVKRMYSEQALQSSAKEDRVSYQRTTSSCARKMPQEYLAFSPSRWA
jgi:hypothetical protein